MYSERKRKRENEFFSLIDIEKLMETLIFFITEPCTLSERERERDRGLGERNEFFFPDCY